MKGQISLIEAIIAIIALFIAFNMMITVGEYQTKWKEALSSMQGRDILITVDRLGKLHDYAFSQNVFNDEFLRKIDAIKDAIIKVETPKAVKSTTYIACDCTTEQIQYLQSFLSDVEFNKRLVNVDICTTTLPNVNPCTSSQQYPDLLIIWGYKDLVPYTNVLTNLKNNGVGIIEIADIQQKQVDAIQQDIFGLKWFTDNPFTITQDEFLKPRYATLITYQSYKWFYHLPYLLKGLTDASSFQMESGQTITCNGKTGTFKFQDNSFQFWICSDIKAYFDTSIPQNNKADISVAQGEKFTISTSNFLLNYIELPDKIRISFKPDYKFKDFLFNGNTYNKLFPIDNDKNKVLLAMGFWDLTKEQPAAVAILSGTEGKTVWLADFARNGLTNPGDDHKQLLASLIFSISNRKKETSQQIGQITSYINVNNTDILEIYKVDLSIGKPF